MSSLFEFFDRITKPPGLDVFDRMRLTPEEASLFRSMHPGLVAEDAPIWVQWSQTRIGVWYRTARYLVPRRTERS